MSIRSAFDDRSCQRSERCSAIHEPLSVSSIVRLSHQSGAILVLVIGSSYIAPPALRSPKVSMLLQRAKDVLGLLDQRDLIKPGNKKKPTRRDDRNA